SLPEYSLALFFLCLALSLCLFSRFTSNLGLCRQCLPAFMLSNCRTHMLGRQLLIRHLLGGFLAALIAKIALCVSIRLVDSLVGLWSKASKSAPEP
ncbi:MAG: hypothetical protein PUE35_06220, partial [Bacteroidales bacterium]|nr:hypothetical protein [Bacteroidales bacterium]